MDVNTTYEPYSEDPDYVAVNDGLLGSIRLDTVAMAADLACGTGLMTDLLLARRPNVGVYAADISEESLAIAGKKFAERGLERSDLTELATTGGVCLRAESADATSLPDGAVDMVIMANAIHLMPDLGGLLREVARVLRPRGTFAFNTVFFAGTFPAGTEAIYTQWLKDAVQVLEEKNSERGAKGQPPVPRKRGTAGRAFSQQWRSPEAWADALRAGGLRVDRCELRTTEISRRGLELVGAYAGLAEVLMSGYPTEIASECLQTAVGRTFDKFGIDSVGRYWLEVVAMGP